MTKGPNNPYGSAMTNEIFRVTGKQRISGRIRPAGNKNAALPMIAATILADGPCEVTNVPRIADVEALLEILKSLGAQVDWTAPNVVTIDAGDVSPKPIDSALAASIRASILLAGPMLARFGKVILPFPGGDVIGRRRVDTHFLAFEKMGAEVTVGREYVVEAKKLIGTEIFLDEPSVTGTENALMAAVRAHGTTVLRNAAQEPHVQDLARGLLAMGAQIEGIGTNVLTIQGVSHLHGAKIEVGPDHIEIGSFAGLAAATGGGLTIEGVRSDDLRSILLGFERLGVSLSVEGTDLIVQPNQERRIQTDLGGHIPKLEDGPWPAFPADLLSIAVVLATQCEGVVLLFEKMFESRLYFVDMLIGMGARIVVCDPHRVIIAGPATLRPGIVRSPDIRAGMAMLVAALAADGTSEIHNIGQIDRGYEAIDVRLRAVGCQIERISTNS